MDAQSSPGSASTTELTFLHPPSGLTFKATVQMEPSSPELTVEVAEVAAVTERTEKAPAPGAAAQQKHERGPLLADVRYPGPFLSTAGQYLVVPMNEGISYPVDDTSIEPMKLITYGGHGICMAFCGVTDGERGQMAIMETADDARINIHRAGGLLTVSPEWEPSMRQFSYARRLRYIFLEKGGHVAMAKRYRAYARQIGLVRTLDEKRKENPHIDLLIGAVNVWCWDKNAVELLKEMRAVGIDRILWSEAKSPEVVRAMNDIPSVLTSRYDIYSDVMDPATFPVLKYVHADWPTAAWPNDLVLKADGAWLEGWEIEGKDGKMYPCGVVNDAATVRYARQRIPAELATTPYTCRFIDTTTATPWREDYSTGHPMTRSQSRKARMELLSYVSQTLKLVTGSETGHDAAVPYLAYFEGMLSLGPYRVPDSGRAMSRIWHEVPADVAKFQMGHTYRLPLWELVYHDCVVAHWYWGDYNNKLPALWDKRDLFNMLYGTPPMFMFYESFWKENKDRFAQSYRNTAPVARATGYSEMTDHRFLKPDRSVQQTTFSNGTTVTVNFGDKTWTMQDGAELKAGGFRVSGPGAK
ncbi:MAG TPA: glycoside hydrolase, partial [Candidatus Methylacidiphilales bacterium]|nr:glycoside hydrolase [Candidatus Methylacidiphilales bacterium]